ncbi:MAG: helix-turn-helix transcriptional regulator [bacterium]|nr:helix-turn-helix transcriptional regulator [bacterium]
MAEKFGELLRRWRTKADRTMGDLAEHLGVSVAYISDVERGNRAPLTADRLARAVAFLNIADPNPLYMAAADSKGAFELDVADVSPTAREVGAALMRGWPDLSDDDLELIRNVLQGRGRRGGKP